MTHEPILAATTHDSIIKEASKPVASSEQRRNSNNVEQLPITPDSQQSTTDLSPIKDESSLRDAILKQLEYYFSRKNLSQDAFLVSQMNSELFVPINIVASFAKIQALTTNENLLLNVMKESNQLIVDEVNMRVRPNFKIQRNTLILRDIPSDADPNLVIQLFNGPNNPPIRSIKPEIGNTWFVSFDTESEAIDMLMYIRGKTWDNIPIPCRLKSENLLKSIRDGELATSGKDSFEQFPDRLSQVSEITSTDNQSSTNIDSSNPQPSIQSMNQHSYYIHGQTPGYMLPGASTASGVPSIAPQYMMEYYIPPFGAPNSYIHPQSTIVPLVDPTRSSISTQNTPVVYPPSNSGYYPATASMMYPHPQAFIPGSSWKWNNTGVGYHYEDGSGVGRYPYHSTRFFGSRGPYRRWKHHDDRRDNLDATSHLDASNLSNSPQNREDSIQDTQFISKNGIKASQDIINQLSSTILESNSQESKRQDSKKMQPRKKQQPQQSRPNRSRRNSQPQFTPDSFPALSNTSPIPVTTPPPPPRIPEGGKAYSAVAASKTDSKHQNHNLDITKSKQPNSSSSELDLVIDLLKPSATQEAQDARLAQDIETLQISSNSQSPSSYAEILRKNKSKSTNTQV